MATENTKTFTKTIKGKKYTLPRISELPYDALEKFYEMQEQSGKGDEANKAKNAFNTIKGFKEFVPELREASKVLSVGDMTLLLTSWFANEKKQTGSSVGK